MQIAAIDTGSRQIRVAYIVDGATEMVAPHSTLPGEFCSIQAEAPPESGAGARFQMAALKRSLDFDRSITASSGNSLNTIDLFARVLAEATECAGNLCAKDELRCVLTVPSLLSQRQRAAYIEATSRAGLNRVKLLDDSLAGCLGARIAPGRDGDTLVFSWGATTFSAVIYRFQGNAFIARAQDGRKELGGDDLDAEIAGTIWDLLSHRLKIGDSLLEDRGFLYLLLGEAERAKRGLIAGLSVKIPVENLLGKDLSEDHRGRWIEIHPAHIRKSLQHFISGTEEVVRRLLDSADCSRIANLLTIGGMTLIPEVQKMLSGHLRLPCTHLTVETVLKGGLFYARAFPDGEWRIRTRRTSKPSPENEHMQKPVSHSEESVSSFCKSEAAPIARFVSTRPESRWADNFVPLLDSAQKHYRENRLNESIAVFEELFTELGKFCAGLYQRAAAVQSEEGHADRYIKLLRDAHAHNPAGLSIILELADACRIEAEKALLSKHDQMCLDLATIGIKAVRSNPDAKTQYAALLARLHHLRGGVLFRAKAYSEAEAELLQSVGLDDREVYRKDLAAIRGIPKGVHSVPESASVSNKHNKTGRNKPCPCGSGKKYKVCCGR